MRAGAYRLEQLQAALTEADFADVALMGGESSAAVDAPDGIVDPCRRRPMRLGRRPSAPLGVCLPFRVREAAHWCPDTKRPLAMVREGPDLLPREATVGNVP